MERDLKKLVKILDKDKRGIPDTVFNALQVIEAKWLEIKNAIENLSDREFNAFNRRLTNKELGI